MFNAWRVVRSVTAGCPRTRSARCRRQRSAQRMSNAPATWAAITAPIENRYASIHPCSTSPTTAAGRNATMRFLKSRSPAVSWPSSPRTIDQSCDQ